MLSSLAGCRDLRSDLPTFTIAILCYNYGRFLSQAIESALNQDYDGAKVEILVIDDGSTDETPAVCAKYEGKVRICRTENEGFGASLTRAIALSRNEWVCLLDADDMLDAQRLSSAANLATGDALLIINDQRWMDEDGAILTERSAGGNTSTLAVKRDAALALLPVENEAAFHALRYAGRASTTEAPLTLYRVHSASMTNRNQPGVQNRYLASVNRNLAMRIEEMTPRPEWIPSDRDQLRIAREFLAVAQYCEIEAHLETSERRQALRTLPRYIYTSARSRSGITLFTLKTAVKALLGRPSFVRN